MLQAILGNHIVDMLEDSEMVIVGEATIERYDIHASNGVIYVIDSVLIPAEA